MHQVSVFIARAANVFEVCYHRNMLVVLVGFKVKPIKFSALIIYKNHIIKKMFVFESQRSSVCTNLVYHSNQTGHDLIAFKL